MGLDLAEVLAVAAAETSNFHDHLVTQSVELK